MRACVSFIFFGKDARKDSGIPSGNFRRHSHYAFVEFESESALHYCFARNNRDEFTVTTPNAGVVHLKFEERVPRGWGGGPSTRSNENPQGSGSRSGSRNEEALAMDPQVWHTIAYFFLSIYYYFSWAGFLSFLLSFFPSRLPFGEDENGASLAAALPHWYADMHS